MGTPRFPLNSREEAIRQITERGYSAVDVSGREFCNQNRFIAALSSDIR